MNLQPLDRSPVLSAVRAAWGFLRERDERGHARVDFGDVASLGGVACCAKGASLLHPAAGWLTAGGGLLLLWLVMVALAFRQPPGKES